ncbi:MAG: hypothetical protein V4510_03635 [bacterium]
MSQGKAQREVAAILNGPAHRGRWMEARQIANELHGEWATQAQVARVRGALNRLERDAKVVRSGFIMSEWRSTHYPEVERPAMLVAVAEELHNRGLV